MFILLIMLMSIINYMLSRVEHAKTFITSGHNHKINNNAMKDVLELIYSDQGRACRAVAHSQEDLKRCRAQLN